MPLDLDLLVITTSSLRPSCAWTRSYRAARGLLPAAAAILSMITSWTTIVHKIWCSKVRKKNTIIWLLRRGKFRAKKELWIMSPASLSSRIPKRIRKMRWSIIAHRGSRINHKTWLSRHTKSLLARRKKAHQVEIKTSSSKIWLHWSKNYLKYSRPRSRSRLSWPKTRLNCFLRWSSNRKILRSPRRTVSQP